MLLMGKSTINLWWFSSSRVMLVITMQRVTIINHGLTIFFTICFTRVNPWKKTMTVNIHDMLLMENSTMYKWWFSSSRTVLPEGIPYDFPMLEPKDLRANMAEDGLRWLKMGELYEYLFNPCHTLSAFESTCLFWEQCSKKCETAPLFDHSIYASHRWEAAPFLGGTSWMDEEHGKKSGNHVYRRGSCLK